MKVSKFSVRIIMIIVGIFVLAPLLFGATVTLQWEPNTETDIAGYKVYARIDGQPFDMSTPVITVPHPTTLVELPALPNDGVTRYYVVTAFDLSGNESGPSNEAEAPIPDMIPPGPPQGCVANVTP